MKRVVTTQVGADGVLTLTLPLGQADANRTVRVTVETVEGATIPETMSRAEWERFVREMAGRITDPTFERAPQGDYEQRDLLP